MRWLSFSSGASLFTAALTVLSSIPSTHAFAPAIEKSNFDSSPKNFIYFEDSNVSCFHRRIPRFFFLFFLIFVAFVF